jgi:hypothetical protein
MRCNPRFIIEVRRRKGGEGYMLPHKVSDYEALREAYGLIKPYTTSIDGLRELAQYTGRDSRSIANIIAAMSRDCVDVLVDNRSLRRLRASWRLGFRPRWKMIYVNVALYAGTLADTSLTFYILSYKIKDSVREFSFEVEPAYALGLMNLEEYMAFERHVDELTAQLETLRTTAKL